MFRYSLDL